MRPKILRLARRPAPVAKRLAAVYRADSPLAPGGKRSIARLLESRTSRRATARPMAATKNESRRVEPGGFPQPAISGRRGGGGSPTALGVFLLVASKTPSFDDIQVTFLL